MDTPLEISFHNLQPSPAIETSIRKRVAKLERIYPRLVGCRVTVESRHNQHRTPNVCTVHIEMKVPGETLVVGREPHHANESFAHPRLHGSLRQAFHTAEAQLKAFKARQRGEVKRHENSALIGDTDVVSGKAYGPR